MAFFDFDSKVQTLLIAGALVSFTACGGSTELDGATDAIGDDHVDWVVDPAPDVIDTWDGPEAVDPPPDMLDGTGVCPSPDGWSVSIYPESLAWPVMTMRVALNVDEAYIDVSEPTFSAFKKEIVEVRRISDALYEVDYRWTGPVDPTAGWDWDRLDVSWRVVCNDDGGAHERTIELSQILCIDAYEDIWFAWGSDPDTCMVVDCVPDTLVAEVPAGGQPALPRGVLATSLRAAPASDGKVHLRAVAKGPAAPGASFEWKATAGTLVSDGDAAEWTPPGEGVHTVQVTTRSGNALSVNVFKLVRDR